MKAKLKPTASAVVEARKVYQSESLGLDKKKFYNIERDGITQGLLYAWMECRQAARWYLQGWTPKGTSMALTYGNVLHAVLELVYRDIQLGKLKQLPNPAQVKAYVRSVEKQWHSENPNPDLKALKFLELSLLIADATMPVYFEYWHKDFKDMSWEKLEQSFKIPYTLPDGRKTFLRGKMDGVYQKAGRWLFETKSSTRIEEDDLVDMLPFELQNLLYCYALWKLYGKVPKGIKYNIVRRVGLEQKKTETLKAFAARCAADIRKRPEWYFIRMEIKLEEQDMHRFEAELEDMIGDFYDWWQGKAGHYKNTKACIGKYGRCKWLTACSGSGMRNYTKRPTVFRELEDV